jgi:hypothetical protein
MSQILYSMIHDRAKATYVGEKITADNYKLWVVHWLTTAAHIRNEFYDAGLLQTGDYMESIISEQKKLCSYFKD